jgi:hypothetical protein
MVLSLYGVRSESRRRRLRWSHSEYHLSCGGGMRLPLSAEADLKSKNALWDMIRTKTGVKRACLTIC